MSAGSIKAAWSRIRKWYEVNVTSPPQENFFEWGNGASDVEINSVEERVDLTFPPDLRASYRIYNGNNDHWLFEHGYLMPLSEIERTVLMFKELREEGVLDDESATPKGPIGKMWWNPKWIPVLHNGGGDHHCVDLDPAPKGAKGQIIKFKHEIGPTHVVARSFAMFLSQFADDLDDGRFVFDDGVGAVRRIGK